MKALKILIFAVLLIGLIAFQATAAVGGFPPGSDWKSQYVVLGDMDDWNLAEPIFEKFLYQGPLTFTGEEVYGDEPQVILTPVIRFLLKPSKVTVYPPKSVEAAVASLSVKPDVDLSQRLLFRFDLYIGLNLNDTEPQYVRYYVFSGSVQGDRNQKPGAENFGYFGVGGALNCPISLTGGETVIDTITHHDIRACSSFVQEICATGWDDIIHQDRSSCEGCAGLDREVYGWVDHWAWDDDWDYGKCPGSVESPTCQQKKVGIFYYHRHLENDRDWEQIGWNWPVILVRNQSCAAYEGEIIGGYNTYTFKSVNGQKIEETYVSLNGQGTINYRDVPIFEWQVGDIIRLRGIIRGVIPGDLIFAIPFTTETKITLPKIGL